MKKLLLATALTAAFASSALADKDNFYVRLDAGAGMAPKQTVKAEGSNQKLKSSTHFVGGLGVGVYLMDNVRTELALSNHFGVNQSSKDTGAAKDGKVKAKATAMSVHIKGLVDVYDYGMGQLFVGAGVGLTQLGAKGTYTLNAADKTAFAARVAAAAVAAGVAVPAGTTAPNSIDVKAKKKTNFSWLLTVGTGVDVAEGVKLDVAYTYENAGSTKDLKNDSGAKFGKYKFSSHNLTAGVRFEL